MQHETSNTQKTQRWIAFVECKLFNMDSHFYSKAHNYEDAENIEAEFQSHTHTHKAISWNEWRNRCKLSHIKPPLIRNASTEWNSVIWKVDHRVFVLIKLSSSVWKIPLSINSLLIIWFDLYAKKIVCSHVKAHSRWFKTLLQILSYK